MGKDEQAENVIIELGKIGIVQESKQEFGESLFRNVYKEAGMLTAMIESEQSTARQKRCAVYEQPDNIITFVGRRGTGKTSSMLSFMDALKKTKNTEILRHMTEEVDPNIEEVTNIEFIGLEWIDASIMEKGEDIFEMILAKMIGDILKEDTILQDMDSKKEYRIRELHKKLGSIYQKILKLKLRNTQQVYREESPISSLRELARSIDLRQEFEELIEYYLSVKSENGSCTHNSFLVVAIDDVDMNINYGFDILEQIQRYLKVKGLLVLLSIDYEQMLRCCEKHFKQLYKDEQKRRQVAESYITKVLPFNRRVYLPSLKKRDYGRKYKMQIKMDDKKYSIKETLFKMIWERTMIQYDTQGKKRHFMEPNNLRELNNYFLFLKGMPEIEKNLPSKNEDAYEEKMQRMERNYRRIMDDLLFRFAEEYLPIKEKEYFLSLSEEDIRRRGEIVVSNFIRDVANIAPKELRYTVYSDKYGNGLIHGFVEETETFGYSFGQFIRCLYFMGREIIYDKKLVHALLAMYTSAMTRIFYRYRHELQIQDKIKGNYNMLKTLLGGSAAGSWSLYIMPMISINNKEIRFSGATGPVKLLGLKTPFISNTELIDSIKVLKNGETSLKMQLIKVMKQIRVQLLFSMFFTGFSDLKSGYKLSMKKDVVLKDSGLNGIDPWKSNKEECVCLINLNGAQFNVLNFINNIFNFTECVENYIILLLELSGKTKEKHIVKSVISDLQKRDSFYRQMLEWEKNYGGAVVPFYSVDIYYNLLKRLAREQRQSPSIPIKQHDLFNEFLKLLKNIEQHLNQIDKFYDFQTVKHRSFCKIFKECPFIKFFFSTNTEQDRKNFEQLYNKFVYDMICKDYIGNRLQQINDKMNYFWD